MKLKRVMLLATLLVMTLSAVTGGTIAWFTDSVNSGANTIKAGNLDVEITHTNNDVTDETVDGDTELFKLPTLWEPGAVAWENLTVKNVGNLALQYKMVMNGIKENTVVLADGTATEYKLSDVLKVGVVKDGVNATKREDAIAAATGTWTDFAEFAAEGKLLPAGSTLDVDGAVEESETYGVVIYWQPGDEDNNWNVHNGKTTSDSDKDYLYIEIGIALEATQLPAESDAFDNQYDADTDDEDEGNTATLIPEGGVYYVKAYDWDWNFETGGVLEAEEICVAGEPFPDPQPGDVYRYGNYEYCYGYDRCCDCWGMFCCGTETSDGWLVWCRNNTEYPGMILSSINNEAVLGLAMGAFDSRDLLKEVDLSSNTNFTTIAFTAFNFSGIEKIIIPDSVTSIEAGAFFRTSLITVDFEDSNIITIADNAFAECKSLTDFVFPNGVTTIESQVLRECTALENVVIPGGVTAIGIEAFNNCTSLNSITFKGTMAQWEAIEKASAIDEYSMDWNYNCPEITVTCTDGTVIVPAWTE